MKQSQHLSGGTSGGKARPGPGGWPRGRGILGAALAAALLGTGAAALAEPDRACPACKHGADATWRFCPFDGTALPAEAPRAPEERPPGAPAPATPEPRVPEAPRAPEPTVSVPKELPPGEGKPLPDPLRLKAPSPTLTPPAAMTGRVRKIPTETIDDLFAAIAANDEAGIRRCYRWNVFFADVPPADLDAKIGEYVKRLGARVRPSLEGRKREPGDRLRMGRADATLNYVLRDPETRAIAATYEFDLTLAEDGWKVVAIRP